MIPLILGTVLALAALAFVLVPLFFAARAVDVPAPPAADAGTSAEAIAALREVEFDRETGKLSDADYTALKAAYTRDALAALRAEDAAPGRVSDAEVEAMILAYRAPNRVCAVCGPRPEPDAIYCSTCGRYLTGSCARCGASVTEPGARYCPACGATLAA
ncbi:MAG TPA: zinc ribbon domain-containing protein [Gemmatimonadaceae bacterium]|nr:zinc ribbon domain-containing protein [Gemmatimonadaceae bacterium]